MTLPIHHITAQRSTAQHAAGPISTIVTAIDASGVRNIVCWEGRVNLSAGNLSKKSLAANMRNTINYHCHTAVTSSREEHQTKRGPPQRQPWHQGPEPPGPRRPCPFLAPAKNGHFRKTQHPQQHPQQQSSARQEKHTKTRRQEGGKKGNACLRRKKDSACSPRVASRSSRQQQQQQQRNHTEKGGRVLVDTGGRRRGLERKQGKN